MRLLFFKEAFAWPRAKGHDVHGYYMMKALGELGHEVSLVTLTPPPPESVQGSATRFLPGAGGSGEPEWRNAARPDALAGAFPLLLGY